MNNFALKRSLSKTKCWPAGYPCWLSKHNYQYIETSQPDQPGSWLREIWTLAYWAGPEWSRNCKLKLTFVAFNRLAKISAKPSQLRQPGQPSSCNQALNVHVDASLSQGHPQQYFCKLHAGSRIQTSNPLIFQHKVQHKVNALNTSSLCLHVLHL